MFNVVNCFTCRYGHSLLEEARKDNLKLLVDLHGYCVLLCAIVVTVERKWCWS